MALTFTHKYVTFALLAQSSCLHLPVGELDRRQIIKLYWMCHDYCSTEYCIIYEVWCFTAVHRVPLSRITFVGGNRSTQARGYACQGRRNLNLDARNSTAALFTSNGSTISQRGPRFCSCHIYPLSLSCHKRGVPHHRRSLEKGWIGSDVVGRDELTCF